VRGAAAAPQLFFCFLATDIVCNEGKAIHEAKQLRRESLPTTVTQRPQNNATQHAVMHTATHMLSAVKIRRLIRNALRLQGPSACASVYSRNEISAINNSRRLVAPNLSFLLVLEVLQHLEFIQQHVAAHRT